MAFGEELTELVAGGAALVAVVRGDQLEAISNVPSLSSLMSGSDILLPAVRDRELRDAIERPAQRAGLFIEPEAVDEIVADSSGSASCLPLVQTALLETWIRRQGLVLTLDGYRASGGVRGAIARMAEDVFTAMPEPQQTLTWRMMVRLADASNTTSFDVRRRVPIEHLAPPEDPDAVGGVRGTGPRSADHGDRRDRRGHPRGPAARMAKVGRVASR